MLVLKITKNVQTGETTEEWVEDPDVISPEQGKLLDAAAAHEVSNEGNIRAQIEQGMATLQAFIDLPSPTNAQVLAQVRFQARALRRVGRLLLRRFDATD